MNVTKWWYNFLCFRYIFEIHTHCLNLGHLWDRVKINPLTHNVHWSAPLIYFALKHFTHKGEVWEINGLSSVSAQISSFLRDIQVDWVLSHNPQASKSVGSSRKKLGTAHVFWWIWKSIIHFTATYLHLPDFVSYKLIKMYNCLRRLSFKAHLNSAA